ncbi:MAG: hypothetical protein CL931_07105 [Deltaproteobacteria bacterium]|nr:hypothetical protein [Deltaproteobacteria bacterium]
MTLTNRRFRHRRHRPFMTHALLALALVVLVVGGCRSQNSNDSPAGGTTAAFAQTATGIAPGGTVSFTNNSTGDYMSLLWDFGDGATSTDENPDHTYAEAGTYTVTLTLATSQGTSARTSQVIVAGAPTAGFTCTPDFGFVPTTISCSSTATDAVNTRYEIFEAASPGVVTTIDGAAATFELTVAGDYNVTQIVDNGIGVEDDTTTSVAAYDLSISASVPSGSGPAGGPIGFSADAGGAPAGELDAWFVNGVLAGIGPNLLQNLGAPGTYTIQYQYNSASPPLTASTEISYVVAFGVPAAAFSVSTAEGPGPLDVTFTDTSGGTLTSWSWDFGDGTSCDFPAPDGVDPSDPSVCISASPTHTYETIGYYDVTLTVTGQDVDPSDPELADTVTQSDAVLVTILDPSFENQTADEAIGNGWTPITPAGATAAAQHIALAEGDGADGGMPTEGTRWAALDGLGTDGSDPASTVENGIRQIFLRPASRSVLEFDYVLLYSEPRTGAVFDEMTATVSDGTTTVEIASAQADVTTPFAGPSTRFPTLDEAITRATPVRTASLDLATAFPGAAADQVYTLTIRLTNDVNAFRSPRAYVDAIRFTSPAEPFIAGFRVQEGPIIAGQPIDFMDETCPAGGGCVDPTSWRWDFDTHLRAAAITSSGSAEQDPSYTFVEAGDYEVRLLVRNADQESLLNLMVTVLEAAVAVPAIQSLTGTSGAWEITFEDQSTSDPMADPIVAWSWDIPGRDILTDQNPAPVLIEDDDPLTIRLTITTASGYTDTQSLDVIFD